MAAQIGAPPMPEIRVPALWTFAGLIAGIGLGAALQGSEAAEILLPAAETIGGLWLRALQMTILPLVSALIVTGIVRTVAAASAGAMARRTLGLFAGVLFFGAIFSALVTPLLLELSPVPPGAVAALRAGGSEANASVPGLSDFLANVVPANIVAAAAEGAMLPVVVFFALFGLALTRLPEEQRGRLASLFEALAAAMLVIIGWVLALAPIGVLALGFAVAARSGTAAIAGLAHYIVVVSAIGGAILLAAYGLAVLGARRRIGTFARAVLPAQTVAISTQSSLASLPAMLAASRTLGLRESSAEFVLPLAVALFRATSPAMNLAVAIYIAQLAGVPITPPMLAAGLAVAMLTTLGAPSLPGTISFVTTIAPIALAMGVPVEPLALLVAVEVLPDIMRTVANVTMDVAVTATVDRKAALQADQARDPASLG